MRISKSEFAATVLDNPYIPTDPTIKQAEFLVDSRKEVLYGGAGGGGKSIGLLMAALMYVTEPKYTALILRRTYKDLALPEAIMDVSHQWLQPTDAHWNNENKSWEFPSGATLTFGYLETENDKYRYQGAKFDFCAFDELTQFTESQYTYLFSRIRRSIDSNIPSRMRCASNPGGSGHLWVRDRFLSGATDDRNFIPAGLADNPYLDQEEYIKMLSELDPVTRAQLQDGNWDISVKGEMFKSEWFSNNIVDQAPPCERYVRYWDCASTEATKGKDPDWTVGVLLGVNKGIYYIIDVQRFQKAAGESDSCMYLQATIDGKNVAIREEQEGGSAGKKIISMHSRGIFNGYDYQGIPSSGDKATRAKPFSSACYNGNVKLVRAPWNNSYIWELAMFPQKGVHDDQIDASTGAYNFLSSGNGKKVTRQFRGSYGIVGGLRV